MAISREDLFARLDHPEGQGGRRRSQLIPRAKLIDRTIRDNKRYKGLSADNLNSPDKPDRSQSRRNSAQTLQDFTSYQETLYFDKRQHRKNEPLYSYISLQNIHENSTQHDSLDSNYNNKSSIGNIYRVSYEDLPELSLPNYYPDARYDTDNTDNISLTDNISSLSLDNLSKVKWERTEYDSIPYDENIVLSTNKSLYEESKPRTIRNPTPYNENYGKINPNTKTCEHIPTPDKSIEETDSNLDEINLKIENISKTPELEVQESPVEVKDPPNNLIKTLLEVPGSEVDADQYKTVVSVESPADIPQTCKENKTHSHNYLREFLETQKGSKKPLQNFIAKKLSNLSRKNSKNNSNLAENQFHSLPDISISKNLRKCEKIDRKLRKCTNKNQLNDTSKENRFIINIGRHFDLTTDDKAPVDFELKIAKVPKKLKKQSNKDAEEQFLQAVKKLKDSLNENQINNEERNNMAMMYCQEECNKEFQEKIGTMKNYWNKVMSKDFADNEQDDKCRIVDVTTKVDEVKKKFEPTIEDNSTPNKVQITKQLFEQKTNEKSGKISPNIKESCSYFENKKPVYYNNDKFQSLCPNAVEIVDANNAIDTVDSNERSHKSLAQSDSVNTQPDFDHVRYKLVKSDLFQKKIFASNCEQECQFDDLIQYLQDYSFQELLVDNNIVIIEPIRSKVPYEPSACVKSMKNMSATLRNNQINNGNNKSSLNRRFFYHPIRVNKEVNEDELPSPDTVRQVRQLFEGKSDKATNCTKENDVTSIDPDKDRCSATDSNSNPSNISDFGSQENLYDSIDNEIYCEYVSEDIMKKIRERGTTVTYYGGRVVNRNTGQSVLTKNIMDEIKFNEKRCMECSNCRKKSEEDKDTYMGVKFKILKSNSCSSRLELVGTDVKDSKNKFISNYKNIAKQNNTRNINNKDSINEECVKEKYNEKNEINESIKKNMENSSHPKIIGEEMKLPESRVTQWKDMSDRSNQKIYNFFEYDKIKDKSRKIEEMEFEPYEVA